MKTTMLYLIRKRELVILMLTVAGMLVSVAGDQAQAAEYYDWPAYSPTLEYDYFDEYGSIAPPTGYAPDGVTGIAGTYTDGWWTFRWGVDKNDAVTEDAWIPMLERFNEDFDYITNVMRWPRDKRVLEGYYSTIYLFGSSLSTDSEPNDVGGGWQATHGGYPDVLASYIPVAAFDPGSPLYDVWQQGAMIHEGIHCILSSMPGCFNSCWFHEGGNTWLQGTIDSLRAGEFSGLGWLSAGAAIAPFMPIECYSGWLQDGSFGGPCAQGVDQGAGICTWRNLLGGTQYGECFPHAMEVILGPKSIAWVWRNASQSGRVLQDMAEAPGGLGEAQIRRLITEYRACQAFCDFGLWSYAFRQLLNNNWAVAIEEEWSPYWIDVDVWYATCYVDTSQNGSVLTPEARTLPGWSGGNQIPLTIDPGATDATVTFNPIGANMSCQLVYRDTSGEVHYGPPVSSGACSIPLANVMNNVIVAVICNTDYIYYGESTRTAKYDYTLTMGAGVTGKADIYTQWYDYNPATYTVTASAGPNGSISPSGDVVITAGGSQTFNFTPDPGYEVDNAILNGFPIGPMDSYTLNNVRGAYTVEVTFKLIGGDEDPPTPNPATWASVPSAIGTDTITMTATTGSDVSGPVEYSFEETSGNPGGSDSGWQMSSSYTDTGLSEGTQYTYRVQMRDSLNNVGSWSTSESATTQFSGVANLALFATASTSYVSPWETLEAVQDGYTPASSSDYSHGAYGNWRGEEYYNTWEWVAYDFGKDYQINSTDVYWWDDGAGIEQPYDAYIQYWNGNNWVNAGSIGVALDQWNTLVLSVVTSRLRVNMISTLSTGILEWQVWGEEVGTDTNPPTPNPATWASVPSADSSSAISMTATTGSDASPPVEYYFEELTGNPGGSDSGWVTNPTYNDTGLQAGTQYTYRVAMRDSILNTGDWSTSESATTPSGLPSPWENQDIGNPSAAGSASYDSGTFTVEGDGIDIWDTSDAFHYVYQTWNNGCEVVAYVASQTNTDPWAKAGVMIRETLAAGSKHAMMVVTPGNGTSFQRRTTTDGTSDHTTPGDGVTVPYWVKVVRIGDTFTGYKSSNGTDWVEVGSVSISMSTSLYVGMCVTSHSDGILSTATFENVDVSTPSDTDPPTPNPATWATVPYAVSSTEISMTATTGSDASPPVEYYFEETSGNPGGSDSGWQTSATYTDSGLSVSTQYTYRVQMRDSLNNAGNWSTSESATTQTPPDTDPPTPNPATWASVPSADSSSAISMTATTGSDASGPVEYYFDETSGNSGGSDSGWQTSPSYTDTGLSANTQYTYRVQMRDSYSNTGSWSTSESATTDPSVGGPVQIIGSWISGTSHAKESGSNRCLVFTVHTEDDNTDMSASVSYGGQSMTKVVERNYGTGYRAYVAAFVLNDAGINAASGTTFNINWNQTPSRTPAYSSVFLGNVNQSSMTGASAHNGGASSTLTTSSLSTNDGDMVVLASSCGNTGTYTCNNGFTEALELSPESADGVAGYKQATGASETPSVTHSNVNRLSLIGFVVQASGQAPPDTDPPTPNPATWVSVPVAVSDTEITMTATTGSDPSGPVEYYFEETSGNPGGSDSGWQTSATYTDSGLSASTQYTYRVQMRDSLNNIGNWSTSESATTQSGGGGEVFSDSFENGEWNGLWTEDSQADWYDSTQRSTDGSYSAEVDGSASDATLTSILIDLQGSPNATVTFDWYIESGLDSGEYLAFDVSTDGGSNWTETAILQGNVDAENTWHNESIDVTGISSGNLRIRFRGKMNRSNEDADVDNVTVTAW